MADNQTSTHNNSCLSKTRGFAECKKKGEVVVRKVKKMGGWVESDFFLFLEDLGVGGRGRLLFWWGGGRRQCGVMKAHSATIATFSQEQGGSNSLPFGRKKDQVGEKFLLLLSREKYLGKESGEANWGAILNGGKRRRRRRRRRIPLFYED